MVRDAQSAQAAIRRPQPKAGSEPFLVFEYLYRDASNYKTFGELWLTGSLSESDLVSLANCLESEEFFVAEQIGAPPLQNYLEREFGGRTQDDHAWHTFEGFREESNLPCGRTTWGKASDLLAAVLAAKGNWKPEMSAYF